MLIFKPAFKYRAQSRICIQAGRKQEVKSFALIQRRQIKPFLNFYLILTSVTIIGFLMTKRNFFSERITLSRISRGISAASAAALHTRATKFREICGLDAPIAGHASHFHLMTAEMNALRI